MDAPPGHMPRTSKQVCSPWSHSRKDCGLSTTKPWRWPSIAKGSTEACRQPTLEALTEAGMGGLIVATAAGPEAAEDLPSDLLPAAAEVGAELRKGDPDRLSHLGVGDLDVCHLFRRRFFWRISACIMIVALLPAPDHKPGRCHQTAGWGQPGAESSTLRTSSELVPHTPHRRMPGPQLDYRRQCTQSV